jgi:hypothetical protein
MKFRTMMSKLSESIHRNLNTYTLAVGTAAVGLLAFAPGSEAKIVYRSANVVIGNNQEYNLDLNHDGVTDFTIQNYFRASPCQVFTDDAELPASGNGVIPYYDINGTFAGALTLGALIGPGQNFVGGLRTMFEYGVTCPFPGFEEGPWAGVVNHYLGLSFQANGQTHYGWARLTVLSHCRKSCMYVTTLTGYAYESIANKSIIAGTTTGADSALDEGDLGPEASVARPVSEVLQSAIAQHASHRYSRRPTYRPAWYRDYRKPQRSVTRLEALGEYSLGTWLAAPSELCWNSVMSSMTSCKSPVRSSQFSLSA